MLRYDNRRGSDRLVHKTTGSMLHGLDIDITAASAGASALLTSSSRRYYRLEGLQNTSYLVSLDCIASGRC